MTSEAATSPSHAIGRRIARREDARLLRGQGHYTADECVPGTLHMAVARSQVAHGRVIEVDTSEAVALDGVHAVVTAQDLAEDRVHEIPVAWIVPGMRQQTNPVLAKEKVFYVGQPVAVVVADDPYVAEDAAASIYVDIEPLDAVVDAVDALADGAPLLYPDWNDNILATYTYSAGDPASLTGDVRITQRLRVHRHTAVPMETRVAFAEPDARTGQVVATLAMQVPHHTRTVLCETLGWPETDLRVITPDVGGGFGAKEYPYGEDVLVCHLAKKLQRPVRWIEDRREHFMSTVHAREQIWDVELTADESGRVLGVEGRVLYDIGGHSSNQGIGPGIFSGAMLLGPYDVQTYNLEVVGVMTNKVPAGAYRGFGTPQAVYVMERLLDELAVRIGKDRAEVRRLNYIEPDAFPYAAASGHMYDSGNYGAALDRCLEMIGYDGFRDRQLAARQAGRALGLGFATVVQPSGLAPSFILGAMGTSYGGYEIIHIRVDPDGHATVYCGSASQGQGHETTLAQACADRLGLDPIRDVTVVLGDTERTPYSPASAIASRVGSVAGSATIQASEIIRDKLAQIAADRLEANPEDLEFANGVVHVRGTSTAGVALKELAHAAHTGHALPEGVSPGLEAVFSYEPANSSYPFGVHAAVVEVDLATGALAINDYAVVHDCGVMLNPMVVEGQIFGGIAQGIGGAIHEHLAYDAQGELLATTMMDYLVPSAQEIPEIRIEHSVTPTPFIPGGMKGVGEAGASAPAAVLANAVADALDLRDFEVNELPLDPPRVWELAAPLRTAIEGAAIEEGRRDG